MRLIYLFNNALFFSYEKTHHHTDDTDYFSVIIGKIFIENRTEKIFQPLTRILPQTPKKESDFDIKEFV
ncbi:MAG: hypothetical protein Q4B43_07505 [Bacteroidota bacterium]|nr:hypothetical protein [Bacteroidota bacterium]